MSTTALTPGGSRRITQRNADLWRALAHVLFGLLPVAVTAYVLIGALRANGAAYDFHWSYYPAAQRLLEGRNPYAFTPAGIADGASFTYPALAAVLLAPFALLGHSLADHLYMSICLLLVPASLRLAGARDWRIYGITLLWLPVIIGWQGGNVSIPIAALIALAWHRREHPLAAGLIVALAISVKTFAWPLALWLLATRRWRAAGWALASGLCLNLLAWAIVGPGEISSFVRLCSQLVSGQWRTGYAMLALANHLGFGRGVGELLLLFVSGLAAAWLLYAGLVRHADSATMVLAVALMLVASPLVWSHYFALLLVPLAICRPRLSPVWALPLAMCLCPTTTPSGWQLALAWVLVGPTETFDL